MVVSPNISRMKEPAITHADRRWKDGSQRHRRAQAIQNGVGDPVTTGGHHRCVRGGWIHQLARPRTYARHDHPALPVTDSAWPHRVQPFAASVGLTVQRVGLLSGPHETPPQPLPTPIDTPLRLGVPPLSRCGAVAWPSYFFVDGSGCSMADTPALQEAFGQPTEQRPGCGFPVARLLGLFDAGTGLLMKLVGAPLCPHDLTHVCTVPCHPSPR
jgi:hypothetical protein